MNVNVFHSLSYGMYVISTWDGERPTGCTANSAMQITAEPATIAISIHHNNYTNSCIQKSREFSISILSEESDPAIIGQFGFQSGKDNNKFSGIEYEVKNALPVLSDSCGYITCTVIDKMETDTHTVFLGKVTDGEPLKKIAAMTYAYYHKVVKGTSPKNAPTYIPEESSTDSTKYVCSICGYEYNGDVPFEDLPDDYKCLLCKQPKNVFKKRE